MILIDYWWTPKGNNIIWHPVAFKKKKKGIIIITDRIQHRPDLIEHPSRSLISLMHLINDPKY